MMFLFHISYSAALATLAVGCALLAWSKKEPAGSSFLKFGGTVIMILSILNLLCIGYYGVRYWKQGYYKTPNILSHDPKMGMMGEMKGMGECPMMQEMMKQKGGMMMGPATESQPSLPSPSPPGGP